MNFALILSVQLECNFLKSQSFIPIPISIPIPIPVYFGSEWE